jgi:hypothetical protein
MEIHTGRVLAAPERLCHSSLLAVDLRSCGHASRCGLAPGEGTAAFLHYCFDPFDPAVVDGLSASYHGGRAGQGRRLGSGERSGRATRRRLLRSGTHDWSSLKGGASACYLYIGYLRNIPIIIIVCERGVEIKSLVTYANKRVGRSSSRSLS